MRQTWRDRCRPIIARVLKETAGQDNLVVCKSLFDAYPFEERYGHPYQIWRDEIRVQLGIKPVKPRREFPVNEAQAALFVEEVSA